MYSIEKRAQQSLKIKIQDIKYNVRIEITFSVFNCYKIVENSEHFIES